MRIYHFVMQNLPIPPHTKKKIYNEISRHFCVALKTGFIPSRQVIHSMREIVPFFELGIFKFIGDFIMNKYVRGLFP